MILQALYEYYQRKAADSTSTIAPEGWEWKEIPYLIVISSTGKFVDINDTREGEGRNRRAKKFLVPQSVKRTIGLKANLLWDTVEYVFGVISSKRGEKSKDVKKCHELFCQRVEETAQQTNLPSVYALLKFLKSDPIGQITSAGYTKVWNELVDENPFITFKIDGKLHHTICDDLRESGITLDTSEVVFEKGVCLITGKTNVEIARLHSDIKGVRGASTKGAALVSYNLAPFWSYNKKQNFNAPISHSAAFAYTTALNTLLGKDSHNKLTICDTTLAFWAEKKKKGAPFDFESVFPWFLTESRDDPDRGVQAVKSLFESIHTGKLVESDERFYVLGLALPNRARLSVRFFRQGAVREFGEKIKLHFDDFEIIRGPKDPEYLSLYRILSATALNYDMDNVPPNLASAVIESILDGTPYPRTLLQQCIRRIRAEQNVTRVRAAILKAIINRFNRVYKPQEKEVSMALDPHNTNPAYLLGRLFAVLEKIQEEAQPGINTTIRDRFYGSASSSPVTVFSQLLKLKNHHLAKLENVGRKINFEKLIREIMASISSFPTHLSLDEQGYFAIGYYHQRQDFFRTKNEPTTTQQ